MQVKDEADRAATCLSEPAAGLYAVLVLQSIPILYSYNVSNSLVCCTGLELPGCCLLASLEGICLGAEEAAICNNCPVDEHTSRYRHVRCDCMEDPCMG